MIVWKMSKSKHQKQQYLFLISSKCVLVSKFNIYLNMLKSFGSIRYPLNQHKTLTKNFNQGLNSGEVQTPKTALIKNKIHLNLSWYQSSINIYTVHLKCFDSIRYKLNQYKTLTKNLNQTRTYVHTGTYIRTQ